MKYCTNCGTKLRDDARFCVKCGVRADDSYPDTEDDGFEEEELYAQYDDAAEEALPVRTSDRPAARKRRIKPVPVMICGIILVSIITAIIILILRSNRYQNIDAKELFSISFSGLDGYGKAEVGFAAYDKNTYSQIDAFTSERGSANESDEIKRLAEEYSRKYPDAEGKRISPYFALDTETFMNAWSEAKNREAAAEMRNALIAEKIGGQYYIECRTDKSTGLKNGDTVGVKIVYDEDYLKEHKLKLYDTDFTVAVTGLESGTEIDPFDSANVNLLFKGINGKGSCELAVKRFLEGISYSIDEENTNTLSNGDTISVRAVCSIDDLQSAGDKYYYVRNGEYFILPAKEMTQEYTVYGLSEIQEIDPFEGLSFEYSNVAPFLSVTRVNTENCDELVKECVRYSLENNTDLGVGDTFIVKAADQWDALGSKGYRLAGEPDSDGFVSKEFTVNVGVPAYVNADNGEQAYKALEKKTAETVSGLRKRFILGSKYISGIALDGKFESIENIELVQIYVSTNNKKSFESIGWGEYYNRLIGLYRIDILVSDGFWRSNKKDSVYVAVYGDNIIFNGTEYETDSVNLSSRFFRTLNDFRDSMVLIDGYTVTRCDAPSGNDFIVP